MNCISCTSGYDSSRSSRWQGELSRWPAAINELIIQKARLALGERVLDVGSGLGDLALLCSESVGPDGEVTGVEINREMIERARARARIQDKRNVRFELADVTALPFRSRSYSAVLCSFAAMYFADLGRALRECARVTEYGGRILLTAWGAKDRNPIYRYTVGVLARHLSFTDPDTTGFDPYRLSDPGTLSRELRSAGFSQVKEETCRTHLIWQGAVEELWEFMQASNGWLAMTFQQASTLLQARIRREVFDAFEAFRRDGIIELPAEIVVADGAV
jgi:ubiquinone/menaquinone biosynthesis C-methylase UbiE